MGLCVFDPGVGRNYAGDNYYQLIAFKQLIFNQLILMSEVFLKKMYDYYLN